MSLRAVLLPHTARFGQPAEHARYLRATLQWGVALALLTVPVIIAAPALIRLIFGAAFSPSSTVFNWLFVAQMAVVAQSPYIALLSAVNQPRLMAMGDITRLMLMIAGSWLLIPSLGVAAPAMVFLVLNLMSYAFYTVYVWRFARAPAKASGTVQITNRPEL
jgi:O-antigen/teichoic acid export membrane protein